jgi:hypothetical protein
MTIAKKSKTEDKSLEEWTDKVLKEVRENILNPEYNWYNLTIKIDKMRNLRYVGHQVPGEKLNDRVRRLTAEGKSPEEIADQLISEKNLEVRNQRAKKK